MTMEKQDDLRLKERRVRITNQAIVELAHLTKETLESIKQSPSYLHLEQLCCHHGCFRTCRRLLKSVDPQYLNLPQHRELSEFFKDDPVAEVKEEDISF